MQNHFVIVIYVQITTTTISTEMTILIVNNDNI